MTVRIVNTLTGDTDADRRTKDAKVRNGEAMAEHLGRAHSAPARADLGILWGGDGGDTDGYPFTARRVVAVGSTLPGTTRVNSDLTGSAGFFLPSRRPTTQHAGEQRYYSEAAAKRNRRAVIDAGRAVSLIAYDASREVYVFDVIDPADAL